MVIETRISKEEYLLRLERLRALMHNNKLHAVLLGTGMNLRYFSGYPSPSKSVARPFFLLLPLRGDPVLFSHSGHQAEAVRFSWIQDVRDYTELSRVPVALIVEALRERGLLNQRVGMELGFEQSLDISYLEHFRLREALKDAHLEDASELLWKLRQVKSESEISCLRHACQIVSDAYRATFDSVREGMPERQVHRTMQGHLDRPETGEVFLVITSGQGNYDLVTKPPEDRCIRKGDLVWMDAGCTVDGYWSDFSRAGVVGEPSAQQVDAQKRVHEITWEAIQRVRPGITASSIARFCYQKLASLNFSITSSIGVLASRIGHGVGLNITEPPHIGLHDDTTLEPGMAITLEPGVATTYGTFHVEENLVVTQEGCDVLSKSPRELQRIATDTV
jgi:Xaa-Pro aminopeptidase